MNDTIYIIGNGFDLHHGLKSSYFDFAKFLEARNNNLYKFIESYFRFPSVDNSLWRKFEENLANLDLEATLEDHKLYLPDISSDEFRSRDLHAFPAIMHEILQNLTTNLRMIFQEFITNIIIPESAYEKKVTLNKDAKFLNFNYTNTLEIVYNVDAKKILYIHNSAYNRNSEIILGHGMNPDSLIEPEPKPPIGLTKEQLIEWQESQSENWDYSFDTGKETLSSYFKDSFKPTKQIITNNMTYFDELKDISNVFILGHSLSPIDLPYFEKLKHSVNPTANWHVSYYTTQDKEDHLIALLALGIIKENIKQFQLEDIQISNNQLKLGLDFN